MQITTETLDTNQAADNAVTTPATEVKDVPINVGGWTMLIVAWTAVIALCVFCFWRLLSSPKPSDADPE